MVYDFENCKPFFKFELTEIRRRIPSKSRQKMQDSSDRPPEITGFL
jgi:hypothetical protein